MSVAYITKYNFNRITANHQTLGKGLVMRGNEKALYARRHIDWFSDLEASRLFLCKILFLEQDHVLFKKMVGHQWIKVFTPEDNFRQATPPKKPRYHVDASCHALHTPEYLNFDLPVGFLEQYGEKGVLYFRQWLNTPRADNIANKK